MVVISIICKVPNLLLFEVASRERTTNNRNTTSYLFKYTEIAQSGLKNLSFLLYGVVGKVVSSFLLCVLSALIVMNLASSTTTLQENWKISTRPTTRTDISNSCGCSFGVRGMWSTTRRAPLTGGCCQAYWNYVPPSWRPIWPAYSHQLQRKLSALLYSIP